MVYSCQAGSLVVLCGSRMQSQQEKQQQAVRWGFNTCARGIVSEPDTEGLVPGLTTFLGFLVVKQHKA